MTAEVAGNAATFSFNDSFGSSAAGSLTFDGGNLYVNIRTEARAEGTAVSPEVSGLFTREKKEAPKPEPTATPVPEEKPEKKPEETEKAEGDYIFPESNTRYLTDEEISGYSSKELELAKNEIYARRGRMFVTERIADYFNGKSWYQGTVPPEEFDAKQDQIFNEYESANVSKIAQWEEKRETKANKKKIPDSETGIFFFCFLGRFFHICSAHKIINTCVIIICKADKHLYGNIAGAGFVMGVRTLADMKNLT